MTDDQLAARRDRMGLVARSGGRIAALMAPADLEAPHQVLRAPEIGSVMVRGRMGATGSAFNLGEMTVTRCSVRLHDGPVGHGYIQGRDANAAKAAALVDALMQTSAAARIEAEVLDPLRIEDTKRRQTRGDKAAATKVEFFTMTRGEDA